jgi:hypothetical protein
LDRIDFNPFGLIMLTLPVLVKPNVSSNTRLSELRREWFAQLDRSSHLFFCTPFEVSRAAPA